MKLIAWLIVAGIGIGLAVWAYRAERPTESTPISSGMIVAARSSSQRFDQPVPYPTIKARVLSLPVMGISAMLGMSSGGGGEGGRGLRFQLSEKLIQVSLPDAGIKQSSLAWGKLPRMERNEVLAGAGGRSSGPLRDRRDGLQDHRRARARSGALYPLLCVAGSRPHRRARRRGGLELSGRAVDPDGLLAARQTTNRGQLEGLFPAKEFDRVS